MGSVYAVMAGDCGEYVSVWGNYEDAYAAAGEAGAMDREVCYGVEEICEEELDKFWECNKHLREGYEMVKDWMKE